MAGHPRIITMDAGVPNVEERGQITCDHAFALIARSDEQRIQPKDRRLLKNIIIGDVHGHFKNLREVLLHFEAINDLNERINKDTIRVYCTGDLIDGGVNRQGDLLLLDYAEEWFDAVVIGNHELPFFGGPSFRGLRKYDRELTRRLFDLEHKGIYVPSAVVENYLLVHAGLAERWSFQSAEDANDAIHILWRDAEDSTKDQPILDWVGKPRAGAGGDDCGSIFWLDWTEPRNKKINQIVGHSTLVNGPVVVEYDKTEHWNIDAGGKYGCCLGGIVIEDAEDGLKMISPFFWGNRVQLTGGWEEWDTSENENSYAAAEEDDEEELDPDGTEMWQKLMEEV